MDNVTIKELAEALTDVLDGQSLEDIVYLTGMSTERCEEIREIYKKACQLLRPGK